MDNSNPLTPAQMAGMANPAPASSQASSTPNTSANPSSTGLLTPQMMAQMASQRNANPAGAAGSSWDAFDKATSANTQTIDTGGGVDKITGQPLDPLTKAVQGVASTVTSSEQGFGQDIAGALTNVLPKSWTGIQGLDDASKSYTTGLLSTANTIKLFQEQGKDTTKLQNLLQNQINNAPPQVSDLYPALNKTNWQVVGDAAGTLADILSAGSYGKAGAETGKLLVQGATSASAADLLSKAGVESTVAPAKAVASPIATTLGQTLKTIGKETATRSAIGGGVGYGSDVINNLQSGKTGTAALTPGLGTAAGIALPVIIGGTKAGAAIGKEEAPVFINSLIKPNKGAYAYDKNPGRTVSEMGITGNSISDFQDNLSQARSDVGQKIGQVYSNPANAGVTINAEDHIAKIDSAIKAAASGGKNNQAIVTQLQNIKDALLYEHTVNADGVIERTGTTPRDLTNLSPQEAQSLIQEISGQTKFTGNPSDDKAVNSTLQSVYGGIRDKINDAVSPNNPEILKLNEQYGGLTSAIQATQNRDRILQNSNKLSMPIKVGGAAGLITAVSTGGAAIPAILAATGAAALDKGLGSTAVKTKVAAWLGSEAPGVIQSVLKKNPDIVPILLKEFPNLMGKLNK